MQEQWMEAFAKWNAATQMSFSCIVIVACFVLAILGCLFIRSLFYIISDGLTALIWGWPVTETAAVQEEEEEEEEDGESELLAEIKNTNAILAAHANAFKSWLDAPDVLVPLVEETNRLLTLLTVTKDIKLVAEDLNIIREKWAVLKAEVAAEAEEVIKAVPDASAVKAKETIDLAKLLKEESPKLKAALSERAEAVRGKAANTMLTDDKVEHEIELEMDLKDK